MDEAKLLMDLVSVPSPTGDTDRLAHMLMDRASTLGLQAWTDVAGNVHMATGEDRPVVLLLCHMDTVPGNIPVRLEDDVLHGRGSVDAKGCLAAAMVTAKRMADAPRGSVKVVAVPDEEGASLGARHLVQGPAPDAVLVGEPSGWQGVTIGYKGVLRLHYRRTTPKSHTGADSSNSAEEAVSFWTDLRTFCEEASASVDGPGLFHRTSPTIVSLTTHDDGMEMTTEMEVDVRLPPEDDASGHVSFLEGRKGDAEVDVVESIPGVKAPKNTPVVRALLASIRDEGGEPTFRRKTGTSDMNLALAAWPDVPIAAYGPGDSRLDHTPVERLDLVEYSRAIRVLEGAVGRLLSTPAGRSKV
jgi:LysW-gamma-L-lysine carboxypeptidase